MHAHREFAVRPTEINTQYIHGPIYRFARVTDREARRLGLAVMPGPRAGMHARVDGIEARRLKDGRLNVSVFWQSPHAKAPGFDTFMTRVLRPLSAGEFNA